MAFAAVDDHKADRPVRLAEALQMARPQLVPVREQEFVALHEARGRVLARELIASVDLPPHNSAAMDGFAIRSADLVPGAVTSLKVIGEAAAGHPFDGMVSAAQAVRILTGAQMPEGADRVVEQELCVREGGGPCAAICVS